MKEYMLEIKEINGAPHYYATFTDGQGNEQCVELEREAYDTLNDSQKKEIARNRQNKRYGLCPLNEAHELENDPSWNQMDQELYRLLRLYIGELTEIQQRRIRLYFEEKKTLTEIGKLECAAPKNILKSITAALDYLRSKKYF